MDGGAEVVASAGPDGHGGVEPVEAKDAHGAHQPPSFSGEDFIRDWSRHWEQPGRKFSPNVHQWQRVRFPVSRLQRVIQAVPFSLSDQS